MNPRLSQLVLVLNLLLAGHGHAQQLQIMRADGRLLESITVGQFVVVELPDRFQSAKRYQGQLTQIQPDTITMVIRGKYQKIPVMEIRALRRVSKFGAWARRSARLIIPVTVATTSDVVASWTKAGSRINQLVVPASSAIGAGLIAYLLLHTPPLKKKVKGYSFQVVN